MKKIFDKGELHRRVDEFLFYIWDPIGVSEEPAARGEYENYIPRVLELLEKNDSPKLIAAYLAEICEKEMGASLNDQSRAHCDHVAELLLDHRAAIAQGLR